jgi:hypothetical protein
MESDVAMTRVNSEYNSGTIKLATTAKEFAIPWNTSSRKATEYGDDDERSLTGYKRNSALAFEN